MPKRHLDEQPEAMSDAFDYWQVESVQRQIVRKQRREFFPRAALAHGQPIEFHIEASPHLYLDLATSRIRLKLQIFSPTTNAKIVALDHVGCVNLVAQALFGDISVELNNRVVNETTNGLYAFRAYIETLLSCSKEYKQYFLPVEGWEADTIGKFEVTDVDAANVADRNAGLNNRMAWFAEGKQVEFTIRPHVDIFQQHLHLPSNVSLTLRLYPSRDSFLLKCAVNSTRANNPPNPPFQLRITEAVLLIETREVAPPFELSHIQKLHAGDNFDIPHRRVEMRQFTVVAQHLGQAFDPICSGVLPDRILAFFVSQRARDGSYQHNPFNFEHVDVGEISLYKNGELNNGLSIKCNFTSVDAKEINEGYLSLYEASSSLYKNVPVPLKPSEWAQGSTIFGFDITPDGTAGLMASNGITKGNVGIRFQFRTAPTAPYNLILYTESDGHYEIDAHGEVVFTPV